MDKNQWTITEIIEYLQVDKDFLNNLEQEAIISPICKENTEEKVFSSGDMERLRLAKLLFEEMDVNIPGIEVILQMRQNMLHMRRQFDEILEDLARRLRDKLDPVL
jgi:MerR family transcriptional regulator/heat shock protein HspR